MFDYLFGWRKASKCKKLIRRVQCRLKLLKNKRCSIVRQLREAVAQLLKTGHEQSAFNRVEQLFKDESIVAVYDLLDHFCEFIIIRLSYIRKHKDCPNDITEAVSSLIFASTRCGDLPELPVIRKLFGERYGQRFARVALELLPGNLVNSQIKESLSIKSVPDDVKYILMDEIARSCLQPGPLALEYFPELQQEQANKNTGDYRNEKSQAQSSNLTEAETKIVYVDFSSDSKNILVEPCHPYYGSYSTGTSAHSSPVLHSALNSEECPMHRKEGRRVENYTHLNSRYEFFMHRKQVGMAAESSSESSCQLPKEMIYLDDIEEFKSPMSKDENCQDQRLFMFKSPFILTAVKLEDGSKEGYMEKYDSWNEKAGSRRTRKSRKAAGKRDRRRSVSQESRSVKDFEYAIYYGESCTNSPPNSRRSHHRRKHQKKISFDESRKPYCAQENLDKHCCVHRGMNFRSGKYGYDKKISSCSCSFNSEMVHECSLEHPCYFRVSEDKNDWESQKRRITTLEGFPAHDLKEEKSENSICHCRCFCNAEPNNQEEEWELLPQKPKRNYRIGPMMGDKLIYPYPHGRFNKPSKKLAARGERFDYLRAITMIPERPNDCQADMLRSNSFPFQKLSHLSNGSSACRHVHPKLPDYDQLAAKFMALKKANLQYKSSQFRGHQAVCAEIDL